MAFKIGGIHLILDNTLVSPAEINCFERLSLIAPLQRNKRGERNISHRTLTKIIFIKRMIDTGMSLEQIRQNVHLMDIQKSLLKWESTKNQVTSC